MGDFVRLRLTVSKGEKTHTYITDTHALDPPNANPATIVRVIAHCDVHGKSDDAHIALQRRYPKSRRIITQKTHHASLVFA